MLKSTRRNGKKSANRCWVCRARPPPRDRLCFACAGELIFCEDIAVRHDRLLRIAVYRPAAGSRRILIAMIGDDHASVAASFDDDRLQDVRAALARAMVA